MLKKLIQYNNCLINISKYNKFEIWVILTKTDIFYSLKI